MAHKQFWEHSTHGMKVAFLRSMPLQARLDMLDVLIFPATQRETKEFIDLEYARACAQRGFVAGTRKRHG